MFTSQIRVEGGNCIEVMLPSQQTFARGCCGTENRLQRPGRRISISVALRVRWMSIFSVFASNANDISLGGNMSNPGPRGSSQSALSPYRR